MNTELRAKNKNQAIRKWKFNLEFGFSREVALPVQQELPETDANTKALLENTQALKENSKAVKFNSKWVVVTTIVAIVGLVVTLVTLAL